MAAVAHLGPSSLSSLSLASSSSSAIVGGGLQFGHAAVAFTPTSLERGGARWGRVALVVGDVAGIPLPIVVRSAVEATGGLPGGRHQPWRHHWVWGTGGGGGGRKKQSDNNGEFPKLVVDGD